MLVFYLSLKGKFKLMQLMIKEHLATNFSRFLQRYKFEASLGDDSIEI